MRSGDDRHRSVGRAVVDTASSHGYGVEAVTVSLLIRALRVVLSPLGEMPRECAHDTACLGHRAPTRFAP
jgi:hypothetical protein